MGSLIGNANLIKKVYFPREVFVVSTVALVAGVVPDRARRALVDPAADGQHGPAVDPRRPADRGDPVVLRARRRLPRSACSTCTSATCSTSSAIVVDGSLLLRADRVPDELCAEDAHVAGPVDPAASRSTAQPARAVPRGLPRRVYDLRFPPCATALPASGRSTVRSLVGLWVFQKLDRRLAEEV